MSCWNFWHKTARKKPFKVQLNKYTDRRIGIVASTIEELIESSCKKFKLSLVVGLYLVLENDGTRVDSEAYLQTLPEHSVLVLMMKGEHYLIPNSTEAILDSLMKCDRMRLWNELQNYTRDHHTNELLDIIYDSVRPDQEDKDVLLESREEHASWFNGLEKSYTCKDGTMTDMAKRRIRSYYYSAMDYVNKDDSLTREVKSTAKLILRQLHSLLKLHNFNGSYFSRKSGGTDKLGICDTKGTFRCQGVYNREKCEYSTLEEGGGGGVQFQGHEINPYASREQRIVFSTWNLDHRIEKTREILPSFITACQSVTDDPELTLNVAYFYSLLFTLDNLRLVHIACHDKQTHAGFICDKDKIMKTSKQAGDGGGGGDNI